MLYLWLWWIRRAVGRCVDSGYWCLGFSLWWLPPDLFVMFMCKFGLCFVVLFGLVVCLLVVAI